MQVPTTVRRRLFRGTSAILVLLGEQERSGLSVRSFCAARSIAEGSFHNWKKRYAGTNQSPGLNGFGRVQLATGTPGLFAEVKGIKLYQPVSTGYLKELAS